MQKHRRQANKDGVRVQLSKEIKTVLSTAKLSK
jgi:hypothetical protein